TTVSSLVHVYQNAATNNVTLAVTGPVGSNSLFRAAYIQITNLPPNLVISPTNLDFGTLIIGQSATQTIQVINTGGMPLNGTVAANQPFAITFGSPFSVNPGQTGQVAVVFTPSASGNFSDAIVFSSNGGSSTNGVTGAALTPPQLGVSPLAIDFGTIALGS